MLWALGFAVPLLAQAQMNVGNPPPSPPPQANPPYAYPYPYGLAPRPKKKSDRCARAETPYERALCEDETNSGTKARCGTDRSPC